MISIIKPSNRLSPHSYYVVIDCFSCFVLHSHCFICFITGDLYLLIPFTCFSPLPVSGHRQFDFCVCVFVLCEWEHAAFIALCPFHLAEHDTLYMQSCQHKWQFFLKLFIYLAVPGLVASRGLQLPDQGPNPSPLHGERRVLATEPPGKSQDLFFNGWMIFCSMYTTYSLSMCLLMDVGYFHFLLFVNSTAVNKWVNASFWINVIIFFK